jgi:ribonuclease BN (tRNA processing enzyme)
MSFADSLKKTVWEVESKFLRDHKEFINDILIHELKQCCLRDASEGRSQTALSIRLPMIMSITLSHMKLDFLIDYIQQSLGNIVDTCKVYSPTSKEYGDYNIIVSCKW